VRKKVFQEKPFSLCFSFGRIFIAIRRTGKGYAGAWAWRSLIREKRK